MWEVLVEPDTIDTSEQFLFSQDAVKIKKLKRSDDVTDEQLNKDNIFDEPIFADSFKNVSSAHLHQILSDVDPGAANMFHPNNKRRIIRALQVCQSGKKYSEVIEAQKTVEGGSSLGGPLRFKNTLIFWLQCQKNCEFDELIS